MTVILLLAVRQRASSLTSTKYYWTSMGFPSLQLAGFTSYKSYLSLDTIFTVLHCLVIVETSIESKNII